MHLLAARPGGFTDDEGIIDLKQTPADIIILSSQDTSLALLAEVADTLGNDFPSLRLANTVHLNKAAAYDLYEHSVLQHAKLIVVSLLGGKNYWPYAVEQLCQLAQRKTISLILVPGDGQPDEELFSFSTTKSEDVIRVWRYLREGGRRNATNLFAFLQGQYFQQSGLEVKTWEEPRPLPHTFVYHTASTEISFPEWQLKQDPEKTTALLLFYRSHLLSGNICAFDEFITILNQEGLNVLPIATESLRNSQCLDIVNALSVQATCTVIINTTSFAQQAFVDGSGGNASMSSTTQGEQCSLFVLDIPVIQAILAANSREDWEKSSQGLRARDIAMNIALPEYDGRIISRAISFKKAVQRSERTQTDVIRYELHPERATFVAELARRWSLLSSKHNADKRVALILANYPTKDGRIGNGVGLDTPASTINILRALKSEHYPIEDIPEHGDALIRDLLSGVTNDIEMVSVKACHQSMALEDYQQCFQQMPRLNQQAVIARWGAVESDPKFRDGRVMIAGIRLGMTFVGIQPARGFNMDVVANYHSPDLVPPHSYLAFYFWLRHIYQADAIAHIGKHGNLEWLPGKSVALSEQCWTDVLLGPLPHIYPFIVNDPGEGAQAKRRAQAVIIDHLMPPMARAETYGALQELENCVDEFYQALGVDPRREEFLRKKILAMINETNLYQELSSSATTAEDGNFEEILLNEVDSYLCELKEAQIRNGLHIFGQIPDGETLAETLVALLRLPRGEGAQDLGILHSIASDLHLLDEGDKLFDPLKFNAGEPWLGNRPSLLQKVSTNAWRTKADTRERLELFSQQLVTDVLDRQVRENRDVSKVNLPLTEKLLCFLGDSLLKAVVKSGENEIHNFIAALAGKYVPAGPSGAPTRGRLDVLPTGRNFYSIDNRAIPTRSAWELGQQSAELLVQRHMQEHGDYPRQIGISVWGTSTMRTGGDDIAQAFALMGVRPLWAEGSNRVVDVEIVPGFQLNRPRVDVTLRISGFFRDAFPNVAKLFDTAVKVLATYEDSGDINTIRHHIQRNERILVESGMNAEEARQQSQWRVFGSKPGAYGAGLQGLIDERVWDNEADLAKAYVNWGGYVYSKDNFGGEAFEQFEQRLSELDAVVQNQDNREHDLLDSDDYYQFQGGMTNAVRVLKGNMPAVYHGDHSNPAAPKIKTLKEELNKVIRSRMTNPKWIRAMQQHGYKGASEMAASVDYLFAYDATTGLIDDYQYQAVTDSLLLDDINKTFLQSHNIHAMKEMIERLLEAQQRGLWNDTGNYRKELSDLLLEIDERLETAQI